MNVIRFIVIYSRMPAAPPPENGGAPVPKTELQELQFKAQQTTDDVSNGIETTNKLITNTFSWFFFVILQSLESTRRMLALCEEVSDNRTLG